MTDIACYANFLLGFKFADERTDKTESIDIETIEEFIYKKSEKMLEIANFRYQIKATIEDIVLCLTDNYLFILCNPFVCFGDENGELYGRDNVIVEMIEPQVRTDYPRVSILIPEICCRMEL